MCMNFPVELVSNCILTYSVLWTPPVLAWLSTCVRALGFNMFLQMILSSLLLLLSHVKSHDYLTQL